MEPEPPRRENPFVQGARYGGMGCVGCLTFVVLAFVALALIVALHSAALIVVVVLLLAGAGVYSVVKRPRG